MSVSPPRRAGGVWCLTCRALSTLDQRTGKCLFCDELVLGGKRQAPGPRGPGARSITPRVLAEAYDLYLSGLSLMRVAREIHPRTTYASVRSCAVQLQSQFAQLGWPLRDFTKAREQAKFVHGLARDPQHRREQRKARGITQDIQCSAIKTRPGRGRNERCERPALLGSEHCIAHDPNRRTEVLDRLAGARSLSSATHPPKEPTHD